MLSSVGSSRWFWDVWGAYGLCRLRQLLSLPRGLTCKDFLHHRFCLKDEENTVKFSKATFWSCMLSYNKALGSVFPGWLSR